MKNFILLGLLAFASPAFANTYCHIELGPCLDPQVNDTPQAYEARYTSDVTKLWAVVLVPDGTMQGAAVTNNGNGTYSTTNIPPHAPPTPSPVTLNKQNFDLLCFAALGGGATGIGAFQAILDAGTAAGGAAKGIVSYYNASTVFQLADVQTFATILVSAGAMTQGQANAIFAAWPMQ